jgi:hypothetical protein
MKAKLLILLLIRALISCDPVPTVAQTITAPNPIIIGTVGVAVAPIVNFDTISVLMLVSDTSQFERNRIIEQKRAKQLRLLKDTANHFWVNTFISEEWGTTYPTAYHMKGYEVVNNHLPQFIIDYEGLPNPHIAYLDSEKKPLNKNIVCWMSINMK